MSSDNVQKIVYEKKLFTFIDILGFECLVNSSKDDPNKIWEIYDLLKTTREMAQRFTRQKLNILQVDLTQYAYHMFSDIITMSCPYKSHDDLVALAAWAMIYQYKMLAERGIFLRGAMVYGDVYEEKDIVFGPAIISAYHLERNKALWPRVLVDQSVLGLLTNQERKRDFAEYLREDDNGLVFLDYLRELFAQFATDQCSENPKGLGDPIKLFNDHKLRLEKATCDIVKGNLKKKRDILHKYRVLALYHNRVIDQQCRTIHKLTKDTNLVRNIVSATMKEALSKHVDSGSPYKSPYTAENLKYVDIMTVLGIVLHGIIADKKKRGVASSDPVKVINVLCSESPSYLHQLNDTLQDSKINLQGFS